MHQTIVSKFDIGYFLKGFVGAVFFISATGYISFFAIFGNPENRVGVIGLALFLVLITTVFFYFFSNGWKTITIGPGGIVVKYLHKKQVIIQYSEITSVYKPVYTFNKGGGTLGYTSTFVIEFGKSKMSFSGSEYRNYDELCAAVYNYKYGFDRQRSQY